MERALRACGVEDVNGAGAARCGAEGDMEHNCKRCGKLLEGDEIALYRKLIWREASEYLCLECLSKDLSSSPERLRDLIHYYRTKQKCCLFV